MTQKIKENGFLEPIKYVEYEGDKYIVDGHHRVIAAKQPVLHEIPVERVSLPYKGYGSFRDLFW